MALPQSSSHCTHSHRLLLPALRSPLRSPRWPQSFFSFTCLKMKGSPSLLCSSLCLFNPLSSSSSLSTTIGLPLVIFKSSFEESSITIIFGVSSTSSMVGLSRVVCSKGPLIPLPNSSLMEESYHLKADNHSRLLDSTMVSVWISLTKVFNTWCFKGRMPFAGWRGQQKLYLYTQNGDGATYTTRVSSYLFWGFLEPFFLYLM